MFAADAELEIGAGLAAAFGGDLHQLAHAFAIEADERVLLDDALALIGLQEAAGIVAAEAICGLGQIVGAEAEEGGVLGDLVGQQAARGSSIMVPTE